MVRKGNYASIISELGKHSLSDIVSMGCAFIATKLFYPGATLVRRPFHIRQKANLSYGPGFTTGHGCRFEMFEDGVIELGRNMPNRQTTVHFGSFASHHYRQGLPLRLEDLHL